MTSSFSNSRRHFPEPSLLRAVLARDALNLTSMGVTRTFSREGLNFQPKKTLFFFLHKKKNNFCKFWVLMTKSGEFRVSRNKKLVVISRADTRHKMRRNFAISRRVGLNVGVINPIARGASEKFRVFYWQKQHDSTIFKFNPHPLLTPMFNVPLVVQDYSLRICGCYTPVLCMKASSILW